MQQNFNSVTILFEMTWILMWNTTVVFCALHPDLRKLDIKDNVNCGFEVSSTIQSR